MKKKTNHLLDESKALIKIKLKMIGIDQTDKKRKC